MQFYRFSIALLIVFTFFTLKVWAQVPDRTETDCNDKAETLSQWLGQGIPVLVLQFQFDYANCLYWAPRVDSFANTVSTDKLRIWAPMNFYDKSNGNCDSVNAWLGKYGWSNVLTFPDQGYWQNFNAHFIVLDPRDYGVYHKGHEFKDGVNETLALIQLLGLNSISAQTITGFKLYPNPATDSFSIEWGELSGQKLNISIVSVQGQTVAQKTVNKETGTRWQLSQTLGSGLYWLKIEAESGVYFQKFILK